MLNGTFSMIFKHREMVQFRFFLQWYFDYWLTVWGRIFDHDVLQHWVQLWFLAELPRETITCRRMFKKPFTITEQFSSSYHSPWKKSRQMSIYLDPLPSLVVLILRFLHSSKQYKKKKTSELKLKGQFIGYKKTWLLQCP